MSRTDDATVRGLLVRKVALEDLITDQTACLAALKARRNQVLRDLTEYRRQATA